MAERLLQAQPASVVRHIKAHQSLILVIQRSELVEILLIYVLHVFVYYMYI